MTSHGWLRAAALAGAALVGAVAVALRHQGGNVLDSMWAEDGAVFVQDALDGAALTDVLQPYAGYLHVPSRLVAIMATSLPIDSAAAIMTGAAALAVGALAVFVFAATDGIIGSRLLRFVVASAVILTPVARIESLDSMSNLHFSLLVAAFWALLAEPRGRAGIVASCVVIGAAALSDPLTVLLAPVAAYAWWQAPSPAHRAPVIVGVACVALHVLVIVATRTTVGDTTPDPVAIALAYPLRVVGGLLLGISGSTWLWEVAGPVLTGAGAAVVAIVAVAVARSSGRQRWLAALALGTSLAVFAAAMWLRWNPSFFPGDGDQFLRVGVRYLLAPALLLLSAIVLLVDRSSEHIGRRRAAVLTTALVIVVGATSVIDLAGRDARTDAPTWAAELALARDSCATGAPEVDVPIAPDGWSMTLPCEVLGR